VTVKLTEDQVMDIHLNYHANGGEDDLHTLCKRNDITINEGYSVLRTGLKTALRKAAKGHKFVSWDPQQRQSKKKTTSRAIRNNAHMFGG
jgi:hypothetical protein